MRPSIFFDVIVENIIKKYNLSNDEMTALGIFLIEKSVIRQFKQDFIKEMERYNDK